LLYFIKFDVPNNGSRLHTSLIKLTKCRLTPLFFKLPDRVEADQGPELRGTRFWLR
jgi:hypothetical protein